LSPPIFWKHHKELLGTTREHLAEVVGRLVQQEIAAALVSSAALCHPTPIKKIGGRLLLCDLMSLPSTCAENVVYLILTTSGDRQNTLSRTYIYVVSGKHGRAHFLNHVLLTSIDLIRKAIFEGSNVCVACETGRDLSVGVVTAALQLLFNDDGSPRYFTECSSEADGVISSAFIKLI
jgi:tRNA A64-2'-O-ribosylphosphate transferase